MPNLSKSLLHSKGRKLPVDAPAGSPPVAAAIAPSAEPWTPINHQTFPAIDRACAVELLLLGHLLAESVRANHEAMSFVETFAERAHVMPRVV